MFLFYFLNSSTAIFFTRLEMWVCSKVSNPGPEIGIPGIKKIYLWNTSLICIIIHEIDKFLKFLFKFLNKYTFSRVLIAWIENIEYIHIYFMCIRINIFMKYIINISTFSRVFIGCSLHRYIKVHIVYKVCFLET